MQPTGKTIAAQCCTLGDACARYTGSESNETSCIAGLGQMYAEGKGTPRDDSEALMLIGRATGLGSEHACCILGEINAKGLHGFDKDPQEATRWYREMQKCGHRDSADANREKAAAWLREHP